MRRVNAFLLGVWEFVVGDDWVTAVGVALALALTAALADVIAAWWVMPPAVVGLLALSVRREVRRYLPRVRRSSSNTNEA